MCCRSRPWLRRHGVETPSRGAESVSDESSTNGGVVAYVTSGNRVADILREIRWSKGGDLERAGRCVSRSNRLSFWPTSGAGFPSASSTSASRYLWMISSGRNFFLALAGSPVLGPARRDCAQRRDSFQGTRSPRRDDALILMWARALEAMSPLNPFGMPANVCKYARLRGVRLPSYKKPLSIHIPELAQ